MKVASASLKSSGTGVMRIFVSQMLSFVETDSDS